MAAITDQYTTWQLITYFSGSHDDDQGGLSFVFKSKHVTEAGVLAFIEAIKGIECAPGITFHVSGGEKHIVTDILEQLDPTVPEYS